PFGRGDFPGVNQGKEVSAKRLGQGFHLRTDCYGVGLPGSKSGVSALALALRSVYSMERNTLRRPQHLNHTNALTAPTLRSSLQVGTFIDDSVPAGSTLPVVGNCRAAVCGWFRMAGLVRFKSGLYSGRIVLRHLRPSVRPGVPPRN